MDPLDMMHFHSVIRPGAATLARTPEMRALDSRSYGFATGVHALCVLIVVIATLVKPDQKPPAGIEVAIVMDGPVSSVANQDVDQPAAAAPAVLAPQQMPAIGRSSVLAPGQAAPVPSETKAAGKSGETHQDVPSKAPSKPLEPWELSPKPAPVESKKPPVPEQEKPAESAKPQSPTPPSSQTGSSAESAAAGPPSDHVSTPRSGGEGAILIAPLPVFKPRPPYPREAQREGLSGRVVVRVVVSANGRILGAAVSQSSGSTVLDEAARRGVLLWKFNPGRQASGPVDTTIDVPIDFTLPGGANP